jgi:hypothetical protein
MVRRKEKRKSRKMIENTPPKPQNNGGPGVVGQINQNELANITHLKFEVDSLRGRRVALKKELTFVEADLYRKSDELAIKSAEIEKKYDLKPNDGKIIDFKTGNIVEMRKG